MTYMFRIRDRYTGITYYGTLQVAPDGSVQLANTVENPAEFQDASGAQLWGAELPLITRLRIEARVKRLLVVCSARNGACCRRSAQPSPWLRETGAFSVERLNALPSVSAS
jgi:hypothetical protein